MTANGKVLAIDRALRVLQCMADSGNAIGVTNLSERLEIPKATVYRILQTLEAHSFVVQDPSTQLYSLGIGVLRLSSKTQLRPTLEALAQPVLEELTRRTGEVSNLGIIDGRKVLVLMSVAGNQVSRITIRLGPVADLHASSLGKALLCDKSREDVLALLGREPLQALTKHTITDTEDLLQELELIRRNGISSDLEETEDGLICIGAPIRDWNDRTIAAISISAPKARLAGESLQETEKLLRHYSVEISERLRQ